MEKEKEYQQFRLSATGVSCVHKHFEAAGGKDRVCRVSLSNKSERWTFDSVEEWLAGYSAADFTYYSVTGSRYEIQLSGRPSGLSASIKAKTRGEIEEIFKIIEANLIPISPGVRADRKIRKRKTYSLSSVTLAGMRALHSGVPDVFRAAASSVEFTVEDNSEEWTFDSYDAFAAEYRNAKAFHYSAIGSDFAVRVMFSGTELSVSAEAANVENVQAIFAIVEAHLQSVQPTDPPRCPKIRIFIGHGRNGQWRELKDHLQDKHGHDVEAYEIGARAGHTIRDILEEMLAKSTIAFLVLTAEDEMLPGTFRARQNVVHEAGLFQGRLGFSRAIVLLEAGVEEFSNLDGVQYIPFERDNIRATFGDVLAVIRREFGTTTIDD